MIPTINEDCSNLNELPTLHLTLGDGKDVALPPSAYVMRVKGGILEANNVWDILFFKPKITKVNMCMPFFRYYHSSFNRKDREMHFATAGPGCEPEPFKLAKKNSTALVDTRDKTHADFQPFDVDLSLLVPPSLSSMIDVSKSKKIIV